MRARRSILLAALTLGLGSCITADPNPTVLVRTSGGVELGASTTYGVVFLGTTATSGEAEVVAWFGDGPAIEPSLVESIGNGLFSVDVDIDLPAVPLSFDLPDTTTPLEIRGRDADGAWVRTTRRADEPTATGLLLLVPDDPLPPASSGAGVYLRDRRGQLRLVGLLAGRVQVIDATHVSAAPRERLAAIGPTDLWRLVSYRRNRHRPDPWIYREDIE